MCLVNKEPNVDLHKRFEKAYRGVYRQAQHERVWRGILAPKGTPQPIIEKLADAFKKMTENKSVLSMIKQFGDDIQYLGPDEFSKGWREEHESFGELGKIFKKK